MLPYGKNNDRLHTFLSLTWYDEAIKFVFNFVTKTSELLLAAGVVISTANFLTDGDVMKGHKILSDAWSWAQALAIDSSLGIVFTTAIQAIHERDKIKASIFFALTALLATVAGLLTHFDSLAHAANLAVNDPGVSGIIPLWVLTALRAIAVISFLLASRLKHVSFISLQQEWNQQSKSLQSTSSQDTIIPALDYTALATAMVEAMHHAGVIPPVQVIEEKQNTLPSSTKSEIGGHPALIKQPSHEIIEEEAATEKIAHAYEQLCIERATSQDSKPISARDLAKHANVRRSTCSEWLQQHSIIQDNSNKQEKKLVQNVDQKELHSAEPDSQQAQ